MSKSSSSSLSAFLLVCFLFITPVLLLSDQVYLKNGDTLTGKIKRLVKSELVIKTPFAKPINIKVSKIKMFSLDDNLPIRLNNDKIVQAKILIRDDQMILVDSSGSEKEILLTDIKSIVEPRPKWSFALEGNGRNTVGNSKTVGASGKFNIIRTSNISKLRFSGLSFNSTTDGETTVSQHRGEIKLEYDLKPKFYSYLQETAEDNKMIQLKLRIQSSGGLGYYFLRTDKLRLSFDAGSSYIVEDYENLTYRERLFSFQFAYNFGWEITEQMELDHKIEYLPKTNDFSQYRTRIESNFRVYLSKHLFTNFGVINEYNNTPFASTRKHLATYLITVGLKY